MTTMYALSEEDYRCLRENIKELFSAATNFGGNQLAALLAVESLTTVEIVRINSAEQGVEE